LKNWINIVLFFLVTNVNFALCQGDSLPYISYKYNPIVFGDIGLSTAPASIRYPFNNGVKKLHFEHNNKLMIGAGFSYSWFALRVAVAMVGNLKSTKKYGKSNYFDIGTQFTIKKFYSEIGLRNYNGYVIKDAYKWDNDYTLETPNIRDSNVNVYNLSAKTWYLHNKDFKVNAFYGNRGFYKQQVWTWYLEGKLDLFSLRNKTKELIPKSLQDTTNLKTQSNALTAFDFGVLPGIGYVNSTHGFQYGIMLAAGPMLQIKAYDIKGESKAAMAIVGRYDVKVAFGYSQPRYFVMAHFNVDTKSIYFRPLKYHQTFFYFKIQSGYRFNERLPKKKKKV
jgi:hypothetical protein